MKILPYYLLSFAVSLTYAASYSEKYLYGTLETEIRPFVYRQLSIQFIRLIETITDLPYGYAAMFTIGIFGILFFHSINYLLQATHPDFEYKEIYSLWALCVFCIIFQNYLKPYDLLIASLFILAISSLIHGALMEYLIIFMIACFTRETSILLLPIFILYCWRVVDLKELLEFSVIQITFFILSQAYLHLYFQSVPGLDYWPSFYSNLHEYLSKPIVTFLYISIIVSLLFFMSKQWIYKSPALRASFIVLFPALLICHLLFGQAFEFRTLAEVFPFTFLLFIPEWYV